MTFFLVMNMVTRPKIQVWSTWTRDIKVPQCISKDIWWVRKEIKLQIHLNRNLKNHKNTIVGNCTMQFYIVSGRSRTSFRVCIRCIFRSNLISKRFIILAHKCFIHIFLQTFRVLRLHCRQYFLIYLHFGGMCHRVLNSLCKEG